MSRYMMRKIIFQLDYHMSSQFAGVAMAMRSGLYKRAGIDLHWLPPCTPGEESKVVQEGFQQDFGKILWVGSMEQNTLLPSVSAGCNVKAVAAMFGRSPLCVAGLPGSRLSARIGSGERLRVAAHEDTVELLQRILPNAEVQSVQRGDKMSLLHTAEVDAIQAYDVMETLKLQHDLGGIAPDVVSLEGPAFPDVALGYSQVLFAPSSALGDVNHREAMGDFVRTTFEGWSQAIRDPSGAAEAVMHYQEAGVDHWVPSEEFAEKSVRLCCEYVKSTRQGGKLGLIETGRWKSASAWLNGSGSADVNSLALDQTIWHNDGCIDAHPFAQRLRDETCRLSEEAFSKHGRRPKLVIITVGDNALGRRHPDGQRRLQFFASPTASWFSMTATGAANGVDIVEADLPQEATTEDVLREVWRHDDADGVMLAWPLPSNIDRNRVCAAIPASKDVDGVHYLTCGHSGDGFAPATCSGIVQLLKHHGLQFDGKCAVVIGRSRLLGTPLAALLGAEGATVTLLHSRSSNLQAYCSKADLVVAAAGVPHLVQSDWVKKGAVLINVGTTFDGTTILPDIVHPDKFKHAELVVRTVGPISAAMLIRNVAQSALARPVRPTGATADTCELAVAEILQRLDSMPGWSLTMDSQHQNATKVLHCDFWFQSFQMAADFVQAVSFEAERMNHHPNLQITHRCTNGVTVSADLFTYALASVSEFDFELARRMTRLHKPTCESAIHAPDVSMADFHYELPEKAIAQHQASPREASRLLISFPSSASSVSPRLRSMVFVDLPQLLPIHAHLISNASQVFAARIFAIPHGQESSDPVEVMFLSPDGDGTDPATLLDGACDGQVWRCMVRSPIDKLGFRLVAHTPRSQQCIELEMHVEHLHSPWVEDGEKDGIEASLRLSCNDPHLHSRDVFQLFGTIPLPPYVRRPADEIDLSTYQTVFASETDIGSVAAPTAGLHFTTDAISSLRTRGIHWSELALHVGAGTFRPVVASRIVNHGMHQENFSISLQVLEDVITSLEAGRLIIPVGTTSVRALESLYWLGVEPTRGAGGFQLGQWKPYGIMQQLGPNLPQPAEALRRLQSFARANGLSRISGSTMLCIAPGYKFQLCDALITNFHHPDSTLMPLVSALAGTSTVKMAYQYALDHGFRFLSYGDATLFFNQHVTPAKFDAISEMSRMREDKAS
mmetsp:Transcript_105144/g.165907  ORF Transcript_105144/g.165907 Transcript_105144/m.165907 type:complete len:1180 (+) Transcript_105144:50-3589(+)